MIERIGDYDMDIMWFPCLFILFLSRRKRYEGRNGTTSDDDDGDEDPSRRTSD